jgi:tetratricopeptide (TPR) repeat protein
VIKCRLSLLRILGLSVLVASGLSSLSQPLNASAGMPNSAAQGDTATAAKLIAVGRLDEAAGYLEKLSLEQPEAAGVERMLGYVYYERSELNKAEMAFRKALAQDPHDLKSMQMLSITLFRLGRSADAVPILEQKRKLGGARNGDSDYLLGLCYMDVERYDDARRMIASEAHMSSESAAAYLLTARLLLRREYLPAAENAGQKALALNPRLPLGHELLGEIALARNDVAQAIADFNEERAVNPLYGGLYERLGDAYFHAGNYSLALQALERAVLLEPNTTGPYILLGKVFLQRQDPVTATTYLQRALHLDPGNYITHLLLGQAYHATGRTQEASMEFQKVRQMRYGDAR